MAPGVPPPVSAYRFGPFRLSVSERILERNNERLQLTPKVIDTLFVLVENARHVVTKEALMKAVWPDVTVVESGLTRNISALRKALEEDAEEGSFIETIPRRGYRFVAEVNEEREQAPISTTPVPVRQSTRVSKLWAGLALVASACLGLLLIWPTADLNRPPVSPEIKIGEHLVYKLAPEQATRALEYFERAVAANPRSASAQAGVATALFHMAALGVRSVQEILPRAEEAAKQSLTLDDRSSAAHYAAGMVSLVRDWDFAAAESRFQRALTLDQDSILARLGYAWLKLARGEVSEASHLIEEALKRDPASPQLGTEYCRVFYYLRDYHRAESECRKVLDREPGYALAHYFAGLSLGWQGRFAEAEKSFSASGLMPGVLEVDRAWLRIRAGDPQPARDALDKRRDLIRDGKLGASAKFLPAILLGLHDEAFEALEAVLSTRAAEVMTLRVDPRLEPIRSDARYHDALRRVFEQAPKP